MKNPTIPTTSIISHPDKIFTPTERSRQ